ncbi:hypothetical protein Tco_1097296 [Tanacetum coccineum]
MEPACCEIKSPLTLSDVNDEDIELGERNIKQCKRKISDGHYIAALRVLSSPGVAPYSDATFEDLKTKHPFKPAPSLPHIPFDHHHLIASQSVVLDRIKSFLRDTSCGRDGCPKMLGEYIASAPLTSLVKPSGGIRPIAVGTVWRRLVFKVSALMIGHSLDGYLDNLQFGIGGVRGNPRSRHTGVFPSNIARPTHGVKLLGGPVSVDFDFCSQLVMKRVAKTISLMEAVANIDDPQCELLLLRSYMGISKLYFSMRTCLPRFFESSQRSFDVALCSSLERIVTASGPGFGDWQWRLATLPFAFGGLGGLFCW